MSENNNLLSSLNSEQSAAVQHKDGPLLVLAGAGTGKTRVITYRIAYLIEHYSVNPANILAVTFTNKAAGEMKARISRLIGAEAKKVWMGTFHSVGLAILRKFSDRLGIDAGFGVIDQDDRMRIVRDVIKDLGIDRKKYSPKSYLGYISDYKNTLLFVNSAEIPTDITHRFYDVFIAYEGALRAQRLIDYDDMLSLSLRLLYTVPDVLEYYKDKCRYILVDEYQDTNVVQFAFLEMLSGKAGNICVVGDDDQSIYGWRGAQIENILYFDKHFSGVNEIKLVQNYRSAPEILAMANGLIRYNTDRRGKELVSAAERVGKVKYSRLVDEGVEANFVVQEVQKLLAEGVPPTEIAILYRTNAQSRNFELALNREQVPYKVVGGVGFYQRREIKDILSYIRLYDNPYDDAAFYRMAKTPPKGVGDTLIDKVKELALSQNLDYVSACERLIPVSTGRAAAGLSIIRNMMYNLATCAKISEMIDLVIEDSGYKDYLVASEDEEEAKSRTENIFELYNAAVLYEEQYPEGGLQDFLATTVLLTSGDEDGGESVSLMTLHTAKGLEFEAVFLTGLEEGIFPLSSQDEVENLEEERRLFYVGVTRAKVHLQITSASSRMHHGKRELQRPSRFVKESGLIDGAMAKVGTDSKYASNDSGTLHKGQIVRHELFGDGIVMQIEGAGDSAKVDVLFKKFGIKKLVAKFLQVN